MPRLIIDDREIVVPEGTKVIEAAERLGIMIPRFCYHEGMGSIGACRMCAVKFLQGPFKGVQMSCMIDAQDGMVVSTTDEEAVHFRKQVIEWLMLNHPHDCPVCDEGGQCLLQDETISGGHGRRRYFGKKRTYTDQYLGIFIAHEMNRCIHCYRCSRFYQEFSGYKDLGAMQISNRVYFGRYTDGQLESPFSGNLVDICPTGVYTDKTARFKVRRWDLQRSPSLCIHCSLGCNTIANAHYRGVVRIEARFNRAVNGYFICDRGRFTFDYADGGPSHELRPWDPRVSQQVLTLGEAVAAAAERLNRIGENAGPGAIALMGSARNSLETQSMLRRIAMVSGWREPEFFVDPSIKRKVKMAASRLDGRVAVSLGELAESDFILAIGVDPINEAPMLAFQMRQASRYESPVLVIDPRSVELPLDSEHVPVAPSDIDACIGALVKAAISQDDINKAGPEAAEFYHSLPDTFDRDTKIWNLVLGYVPLLKESRRPAIVCATGIVRESTVGLAADLALLLKAVKEKSGLFYLLPGAGAFSAALMADSVERSFMDMLEAIEAGEIKALIAVESDPFRYFPDRKRLEQAFGNLDFLLAMDYLPSETVRRADVFLPTSTVFETGSTYINQEGRVQHSEKTHHGGFPIWGGHITREIRGYIPGGEHKAGWEALMDVVLAMEIPGIPEGRPWEVIAGEHRAFSGFSRETYPVNGVRIVPERSSVTDFSSSVETAGKKNGDLLDLLLVEWLYGTEEISTYSQIIPPIIPEPYLLMHPSDAGRAGLSNGDRVVMRLDGGTLEVKLKVAANMAQGTLILPRHQWLDWQVMKTFSPTLPIGKIEKA